MNATVDAIYQCSTFLISVIILYRLPCKVLGRKYGGILTFSTIMVANVLASWLNISLAFATTTGTNSLYYGTINLLLYLLLFKGNTVKKVFLAVLMACGLPLPNYILLPFVNCFFDVISDGFLIALATVQYLSLALAGLGMEYAGRKFQNLHGELPFGYTIYLTGVILFVHVAIYMSYDYTLLVNRYTLSLLPALIAATFALAGTAIVWIAIFAVDRQVQLSLREQLYAIQAENVKSREIEWRRFLSFRHDIKNHLICLNGLLENDKTEQAASYMRNLTDTVKEFDSPVQTGNDYADALLHVKYAQAMAAKIKVSVDMAIPSEGFLEPVDLCCILSNAFDNAIAACSLLDEGKRWITARSFIKQGQFVIVIKNSKPPHVTVVDGEVSPKEITTDHGLGLNTVKTVVEKYGGALTLSAEDAFSFSVLIPSNRL